MYDYKCENSERKIRGTAIYYLCKATNSPCGYARICPEKRDIEHTPNARYCLMNPKREKLEQEK